MRKYDPLRDFLESARAAHIALAFSEIEGILDAKLPKSAREYRPWWANEREGSHVQAHAWRDAGCRVVGVDLVQERVEFQRA